jgi:5-methyltetrahydrofolate--homocysteine methyltransferase
VLNSIMLFHAVQAGLDMAICQPCAHHAYADIPEEERLLAKT